MVGEREVDKYMEKKKKQIVKDFSLDCTYISGFPQSYSKITGISNKIDNSSFNLGTAIVVAGLINRIL